jgi:hypothetical protein
MARSKEHTPEQRVNLLLPIELLVTNGKTAVLACKETSITEQIYIAHFRADVVGANSN